MNKFYLHQRVRDANTGRIGNIVKVTCENKHLIYRVNFCDYSEEFTIDDIREVK